MYAFNRYRSLLAAIISRSYRRLFSAVGTEFPKEPIIASSIISNQPPPPPSESQTLSPVPGDKKNSWSFLKYGLITAVTGGVATASYATYAYSLDEVDQKTSGFRDSANFTVGEESSTYDKFRSYARAAAVTVRAKLVDTYLDLIRLTEEHVRALESCLQRENCVPIKQWEGEADDAVLLYLIPFLEYVAKHRPADIRTVLASYEGCDIAEEFMERSKEHQRRMQEQKQNSRVWGR